MPHFYGAVGISNVGRHQWRPYSRRPLFRAGPVDRRALRLLRDIRSRAAPPEYGLRITAVVLTVLVHFAALVLMALRLPAMVPPPAPPAPAGVEVRLIEKPKPPPPPPPPIKLPKRPRQQAPASVKRATKAAMPRPQVANKAPPATRPAPAKPEARKTPPPAAASPPAPMPEITLSAPAPKIVLEPSRMAIPPPKVESSQATATAALPELKTAPTRHVAPQIELGNPKLENVQPAQPPTMSPQRLHAQAGTPEVPTAALHTPAVRIAAEPLNLPSVRSPTPVPQASSVAKASLAPIPQVARGAKVAPTIKVPPLSVSGAPTPSIETPSIHAEAPQVATTGNKPAASASAERKSVPAPASTSSWVSSGNRFTPLAPGEGGPPGSQAGHAQGSVQKVPQGNSDVMTRNSDQLGYKSTVFDQYWAPDNESVLDTFLRRFIEKLTVSHTFHPAPGVRVHCVLGPLAVFLACGGDPPRRPPGNADDPRLNMAPAQPLAPGLGRSAPAPAASAPSLELDNTAACQTARVAGAPPPPGCPGGPPKDQNSF
jgi:hypothetical protein